MKRKLKRWIAGWVCFWLGVVSVQGAEPEVVAPRVTMRLEPVATNYYVGQRVTLKIVLETETDIEQLRINDFLNHDAVQVVETFRQLGRETARRMEVGADLVFLRTGSIQMEPVLSGRLAIHRNRPFGREPRPFPFSEKATPLQVTVLPLPTEGCPENFTGIVGDYRLRASLEPARCAVGDLMNFRWHLEGRGVSDELERNRYQPGSEFRVYPPKVVSDAGGGQQVEQVLIPLSTNVTQAATFSVSVFNPVKAQYETLVAGPFHVTVVEREENTEVVTNAVAVYVESKTAVEKPRIEPAGLSAFVTHVMAALPFRRKALPTVNLPASQWARLAPDARAMMLFEIPKEGVVEVVERHGTWCRVRYENRMGWVLLNE